MKRTILNEPNISKALRLVLFLITMLLLPSAAWGQDPTSYGLTVAGIPVTSANALNITGDGITGTVNYNANYNFLTLDNAQIVSANGIVWTGDGNLTIVLSGNNSINCGTGSNVGEGVCIQGNNSQGNNNESTLIFTSENNTSTLTLTPYLAPDNNSNSKSAISGFNKVECEKGYRIYYTDTYDGPLDNPEPGKEVIISCGQPVGLSVAGVIVTKGNEADIFDNGTVSFYSDNNSDNNKLTLNSATINGTIVWKPVKDLTIAINGSNSVTTTSGYAISTSNSGNLTFVKGSETEKCKLTLSSSQTPIAGFNNSDYAGSGLVYYEESSNNVVTATISSVMSGGTGTSTDPYLMKTPDDLKEFATYVGKGLITTEYIKLNNDIDCSSLTNFETIGFGIPTSTSNTYFKGTFDGNEKSISNLSVKGKGLFYTDSNAPIKITKLTLDNLTVTDPNGSSGEIGAIASDIHSGDVIEGCVVKNSHITCENSFGNPWIGGIVGANYGGAITNCIVEDTEITASTDNTTESGLLARAAGIVCNNSGSVSGCQVKGNTIVTAAHEKASDVTAGAIVCVKNGTFANNTYEFTVKTQTKGSGEADYTVKQNYDQRGIAASNDISGEVELAGTKKVTISAAALSDARTLRLGEEMGLTYCLDERDASTQQLKALSVLPGSTVSLVVGSENGYKPAFSLSKNDVVVTPTEKFENSSWNIKYVFVMPEDDVTATIAFAKDLESKNGDVFIHTLSAGQEAYTYTGRGIEPSISLTTDPQNPIALTKGTDYEIKDFFEVKEGVATPMYEEDGTTPKAPINVGSYKICITGKGNYYGTRELEFTIAKSAVDWSDNRWVAPVGKTDLKYTGADMALVTAATVPEGVTIKYYAKYSSTAFNSYDYSASQNEEWSEEVPTGKEIGYYAVFYKVEGGDNYLNWGPSEVGIAVNIDKGEVTISAEAQTVTYNAQQQAYTGASADNGNVTLVMTYYSSEENRSKEANALSGAPTDAGTYYVSVTLSAESQQRFIAEAANATFTIAQLDIADAVITLDKEELTYNGQVQSVTVTNVMAGNIEVPIDCYEVSGNTEKEAGDYKLTVTAKTMDSSGNPIKNNFTGSAEKAWKINHRTASAEELGFKSETQTVSTYYNSNEDFNLPEGYVAYIITGISGNSVTTQRVSYIPKGVAVLVEKGTSSESAIDIVTNPDDLPLKGTQDPKAVSTITGGTVYVLYNGEFVKSMSGTIPAHRCYLLVATNMASRTRSFGINHGDGTTAIREVEEVESEKWPDGAWHDLQGRRLPAKPTKSGLYLHNGVKVVLK